MKFKGKSMPEWFTVNDVDVEGLNLSPSSTNLNGRIGEVFHQQNVGSKTIEVTYTVVGTSISDMRSKVREVGRLLYSKREEKLEFNWDANVYYNAILSGMGAPTETRNIAQGTLTFLVPDGSAHSTQLTSSPLGEVQFNDGTFEADPTITINVEEKTPSLTLVGPDSVFRLGQEQDLGSETSKPTVWDARPTVFHDKMESVAGWAGGANYEGTAQGSFKTNGYSIQVDDLGPRSEDASWHGPVGRKSFTPTQDFFMRANVSNHKTRIPQLGRIQIQLQDENGINLFMIELRNADPGMIKPMVRAKVGSTTVADTFGSYKGVWKNWQYGELHIERRGTRIYFFAGMLNSKGQLHTRWSHVYNDVKGNFQRKVARVQISLMGIRDADLPSLLAINDIHIQEFAKKPETPNIIEQVFQPEDVVVINSATGEVSLNGSPAYHLLDPSSSFPKIQPGANQYMLVEEDKATGRIEFRERW